MNCGQIEVPGTKAKLLKRKWTELKKPYLQPLGLASPTLYVSRRFSRRSGGGARGGRSWRRSSRLLAKLRRPCLTSFDGQWVPDIGAARRSPGGRMSTHTEGSSGGHILELLLFVHLPADEGRVLGLLLLFHSTVHPFTAMDACR